MSTKNFSPIGPAFWPARRNIYIYINVLFYYIDNNFTHLTFYLSNFLFIYQNLSSYQYLPYCFGLIMLQEDKEYSGTQSGLLGHTYSNGTPDTTLDVPRNSDWSKGTHSVLLGHVIFHWDNGLSCMLCPLAPDPIRVQSYGCLFWTNRNCMAVTSIFLSILIIQLEINPYIGAIRENGNIYFYWNYSADAITLGHHSSTGTPLVYWDNLCSPADFSNDEKLFGLLYTLLYS